MNASAQSILSDLRGQGLRVSVASDGRLLVGPQGSITEAQDSLIRSSKAGLLEALQVEQQLCRELEPRIRQMAERWEYSEQDLAEALAAAAVDPHAWLVAVEFDEENAARGARVGRRHPWG